MPPDDPYEEFLVSPRYLAGTDGVATALEPLHKLGWDFRSDDIGNVSATSPCLRVEVAFTPEGPFDDLWQITTHRKHGALVPAWQATFESQVPGELVRGVTEAIAADPPTTNQGHPRVLDGTRDDLGQVHAHFVQAGWSTELTLPNGAVSWSAPDELAGLLRRSPAALPHAMQEIEQGPEAWLFWGGVEGTYGEWQAAFTSGTPTHLVMGFASALTDPSPVVRNHLNLPKAHRSHVTTRPVPTWPRSQPQLRGQAATSRSPRHASEPGTGGSPQSPAQRPAAPPGPAPRRR